MEDGFVKVISPIEDTPAFKAGIKPNDLIIKLDDTPVKGMSLNDAVKRMRGKPNTSITLTISRKGESAPIVVTLTRAVIRVQSVKSKIIEPGYGWVRVSQFQEATTENMVRQLTQMFKENPNLKGLVLDLRNDPGGLLHGAVAISAAFLPAKTLIVSTDGRAEDAKKKFYATPDDYARGSRGEDVLKPLPQAVKNIPMVVLVNGGSARPPRSSPGAPGPQARHGHRHADFRQGLGADHHAAGQQHRDQADHRALLHAGRPLDPGARHQARPRGRGSDRHPDAVREADLTRHLNNPEESKAEAKKPEEKKDASQAAKIKPQQPISPAEMKPVELGSKDDFQLQQAIAHLKGEPVKAVSPTVAQTKTN
jgi:carboxyl-terminal processing protease